MNLVERFTHAGTSIRLRGTDENPTFCAKDICEALGIANYRNKVAKLDADEKLVSTEWTGGQRRSMVFVTEPGFYKITLSCRTSSIPGTPAHAFTRWVTHEVLPSIRRRGKYEMARKIEARFELERRSRLWCLIRNMDLWSYYPRRKHFTQICKDCKRYCYSDSQNALYFDAENFALEDLHTAIKKTMARCIMDAVPANQKLITDFGAYFSKRETK